MKAIGIGLIRLYHVVFAWLPSSCRYEPTCSHYTEQAIRRYVAAANSEAKPFVWTKTADEILDSVANYCKRITDSGH